MTGPDLVTGAGGFIGRHLVAALAAAGRPVHAWQSRSADRAATSDGAAAAVWAGDICDASLTRRVLSEVRPSAVWHLAGLTHASDDAGGPGMIETNVVGTWNLLDAMRREAPSAKGVLISSGAVYGEGGRDGLDESCPLNPVNEHGASKAAQEMLAIAFGKKYSLSIVRARTFNLVGPGEPGGFVCSCIARQIAAAELGLAKPVVRVGRLDARRDFTDVRDAVAAYVLLRERGRSGEVYNVCSGTSVAIGDVLELLRCQSRVKVDVVRDQSAGIGEVTVQRGTYAKLEREVGWTPTVPFEQSLADLLDWWRIRLGALVGQPR